MQDQIFSHKTLILIFSLIFSTVNSYAVTTTWLGADASWNNALEWDNGIVPGADDHVIIPSGHVRVPNDRIIRAKSIEIQPGGILRIKSRGNLIIEGTDTHGINNNGALLVFGNLLISDIIGAGNAAIYNENGLINFEDNSFTLISNASEFAIHSNQNGIINNSGILKIISSFGGIQNYGALYNTGNIEIDECTFGIENYVQNFFYNYTQLTFSNTEFALRIIEPNQSYPFANAQNHGSIDFEENIGEAFYNESDFDNELSGIMNFYSGDVVGIENVGEFENIGELNFYSCTIGIKNSNLFENFTGIYLHDDIEVKIIGEPESNFFNQGYLWSFGKSAEKDILLDRASFISMPNSSIIIENRISTTNYAIFSNEGILISNFEELHDNCNTCLMDNFGIVQDFPSSFSTSMNNQQLILENIQGPLSINTPFPNALNLAASNALNFGAYWTTEKDGAGLIAGNYDPLTNTFTPNVNALGRDTLYTRIEIIGGFFDYFAIPIIGGITLNAVNEDAPFLGLNQRGSSNQEIETFPNPTDGLVYSKSKIFANEETSAHVFNSLGQEVFQTKLNKSILQEINLPKSLNHGLYYIRYMQNDKTISTNRISLKKK